MNYGDNEVITGGKSEPGVLQTHPEVGHHMPLFKQYYHKTMKYKEEHHEIKKYDHKQETPHYKEPKTESFMFADDYMDEHFKRLREDKMKGKN